MTDPRKPATFLDAAAELRAALATLVCPLMWPAAQILAALTGAPITRDQYEADLAVCYDCRRIGPGQFVPLPIRTEARSAESQEGDQ